MSGYWEYNKIMESIESVIFFECLVIGNTNKIMATIESINKKDISFPILTQTKRWQQVNPLKIYKVNKYIKSVNLMVALIHLTITTNN